MKKTLQALTSCRAFTFTLIAAFVLSLTACGNSKKGGADDAEITEIKAGIAVVAASCPIEIEGVGAVTNIELDDSYLVYNMDINEDNGLLIGDAWADNKDLLMESILSSMAGSDDNTRMIFSKLADKGYGVKFIFDFKASQKKITASISATDLGKRMKGGASADEVDEADDADDNVRQQLMVQVALGKSQCPMQVDELTRWDNIDLEDNNIVYYYTIDEDVNPAFFSLVTGSQMKDAVREIMAEQKSDPAMAQLISLCVEGDYGIVYIYEGSNSGESLRTRLSPDELAAL